jgi:hypothetical protein
MMTNQLGQQWARHQAGAGVRIKTLGRQWQRDGEVGTVTLHLK